MLAVLLKEKIEFIYSMNPVTGYSDMKMLYTLQQGMLPEEKSELNCADNGQTGSCIEDGLYRRAKCKGQERDV